MNSSLIRCSHRDYALSRQHSVDYEQSLQERLSLVVCTCFHSTAPRKNSAPYIILPETPKPIGSDEIAANVGEGAEVGACSSLMLARPSRLQSLSG